MGVDIVMDNTQFGKQLVYMCMKNSHGDRLCQTHLDQEEAMNRFFALWPSWKVAVHPAHHLAFKAGFLFLKALRFNRGIFSSDDACCLMAELHTLLPAVPTEAAIGSWSLKNNKDNLYTPPQTIAHYRNNLWEAAHTFILDPTGWHNRPMACIRDVHNIWQFNVSETIYPMYGLWEVMGMLPHYFTWARIASWPQPE
jgi:hypothetical protein